MLMILVIILIVLALGGLPPLGLHSHGYIPSLLLVVLVVILLVVLLRGRL